MKRNNPPRRNWQAAEAVAKALDYLQVHPEASGSDVAKHLGVSETQGKYYRRLALQQLPSARAEDTPEA